MEEERGGESVISIKHTGGCGAQLWALPSHFFDQRVGEEEEEEEVIAHKIPYVCQQGWESEEVVGTLQ